MLATETATIIARLHMGGLLAVRDPAMVQVWHEDIGHLDYAIAREAAQWLGQHRGSESYGHAKPADLLDAVKRVRRDRIEALLGNRPIPQPPDEISPDDVPTWVAWQQAWVAAAGNGASLEQAEAHADAVLGVARQPEALRPRPVAALVGQVEDGLGRA